MTRFCITLICIAGAVVTGEAIWIILGLALLLLAGVLA